MEQSITKTACGSSSNFTKRIWPELNMSKRKNNKKSFGMISIKEKIKLFKILQAGVNLVERI